MKTSSTDIARPDSELKELLMQGRERLLQDHAELEDVGFRPQPTPTEQEGYGFMGACETYVQSFHSQHIHTNVYVVHCPAYIEEISRTVRYHFCTALKKLFGVPAKHLTPATLALYTLYHEYGHARDFLTRYVPEHGLDAVVRFAIDGENGKMRLPYGKMVPYELARVVNSDWSVPPRSKTAMVRAQTNAYMELPLEKIANDFSVHCMKKYGYIKKE